MFDYVLIIIIMQLGTVWYTSCILVKGSLFDSFSIDIVDKTNEGILWIACTQIGNPENTLYNMCICHLPPILL